MLSINGENMFHFEHTRTKGEAAPATPTSSEEDVSEKTKTEKTKLKKE